MNALPLVAPNSRHVADDDVFVFLELGTLGREHCQLTAGQALAEIVVAVPFQSQCQTLRNERTELCPPAPVQCTTKVSSSSVL